jgi:hypothetical protein
MKIISKLFGGLGNQMFQYACGRSIAQRLGIPLYLDLSWFDNGSRAYMLDIFPNINYLKLPKRNFLIRKFITLSQKILRRISIYTMCNIHEVDYSYWHGIEQIQSSVHLSGYWQNEKYFSVISSIIRQDFIFPEFDCLEAKNIARKITESPCPINIHVRRGDYVKDPKTNSVHGICSQDYYKKALQIIVDNYNGEITPELYFFSDDPDWVKSNCNTWGFPSVVIDIQEHKEKPYHDMHLMSLCQHHIISNSSFSWWGAWLSCRNGIVVAPKRWFADDTMKNYNPSLESWITI